MRKRTTAPRLSRTLGQHYLVSENIALHIVAQSETKKPDTVFEMGAGHGILTGILCDRAKHVVSIERDKTSYSELLHRLSDRDNLTLLNQNALESDVYFDRFVSNIPYSVTRKTFEYLAQKSFNTAVVMVQKEFAQKLLATESKKKRAITVIMNHAADIEKLFEVDKKNFDPVPKVDSVVLKLKKKRGLDRSFITRINNLFSLRNKTVSAIARHYKKDVPNGVDSSSRLGNLSVDEIVFFAYHVAGDSNE